MYLHLGQETVVRERDIIGIFDLDNTTVSRHTRKTLNEAEKAGRVINVTDDLPKTFVITTPPGKKNRRGYGVSVPAFYRDTEKAEQEIVFLKTGGLICSRLVAGRAFCKGLVCTPARRGGRDIACNHLRWGKSYKRV